jgi:hypothetical protein
MGRVFIGNPKPLLKTNGRENHPLKSHVLAGVEKHQPLARLLTGLIGRIFAGGNLAPESLSDYLISMTSLIRW